MTYLRYITTQEPDSRNVVSGCVVQRHLARFICEMSERFDSNLEEKTYI